MKGDPGYYRFFAYLNLFVFFMLILVLGDNFFEESFLESLIFCGKFSKSVGLIQQAQTIIGPAKEPLPTSSKPIKKQFLFCI